MNFELNKIIYDNYKIIKHYGTGGMSEVYLAKKLNANSSKPSENLVIIKVIEKKVNTKNPKDADDQWKKALDEYKLTWAIKDKPNDNVARPIEWFLEKDSIVIITEFVDGPTLTSLLCSKKSLPINKAMDYFLQLINGVKSLHNLNDKKTIIHRDLKPDNIIISKDLRMLKIIDYGIATSFYDGNFSTIEGTIYCTANYTTPDVLKLNPKILDSATRGDSKSQEKLKQVITTQFDFHAMGVILCEMITGTLPFPETPRDDDKSKIQKWIKFDLPVISNQIPNVPNSIENIIFRCTASKEEDKKYRYKSIDELYHDAITWNNPDRAKEPLLKDIDERVYPKNKLFNLEKIKLKEKWYLKWWFMTSIIVIFSLLLILAVVVIVLSKTNIF